ncbi:MAG: Gfo/Idh/MocA family protein [Actinomycetes bacterium]
MSQLAGLRVGIVGTGWMAATHTEALRRLGIEVAGVAGRSPDRAREVADRLDLPTAYDSVEAMVADDSLAAVHVTSPNDVHAEQAAAGLRAGRHVVCEKPLGVTAEETAALVELAAGTGLVNAVCFNLRFSPHNHNAAGLVRDGSIGEPRYVTGGYHQDWLLLETDWNWRLVAERQGRLRAVADIGSHWIDLVCFVTGRRLVEVLADLHTFVPERNHPLGEVGTFAGHGVADDVERVREPMVSDDAAGILLRFEDGLRGLCSVSQVSAGRKNRLTWELNGSQQSLAWTSEEPEYLWIGHRGRPNELANKDPGLMTDLGAAVTGYPAGHVEGYPDTFRGLFAAVYADVAAGKPSAEPAYPTFADGHDIALVCQAVAESARTQAWAPVRRSEP